MHDGRPVELNEGKVPRKSGAYFWTGDVWRGNSWQLIIIQVYIFVVIIRVEVYFCEYFLYLLRLHKVSFKVIIEIRYECSRKRQDISCIHNIIKTATIIPQNNYLMLWVCGRLESFLERSVIYSYQLISHSRMIILLFYFTFYQSFTGILQLRTYKNLDVALLDCDWGLAGER